MNRTVTRAMEYTEDALDEFGREVFPMYHSITDQGEYSLAAMVSREFDVCELMTALAIEVPASMQFRPAPVWRNTYRYDIECAYALSRGPEAFWEWNEVSDVPEGYLERDEYDDETIQRALAILQDSSGFAELLGDYFTLEQVSATNARAQLLKYVELLERADSAYREAGWEL